MVAALPWLLTGPQEPLINIITLGMMRYPRVILLGFCSRPEISLLQRGLEQREIIFRNLNSGTRDAHFFLGLFAQHSKKLFYNEMQAMDFLVNYTNPSYIIHFIDYSAIVFDN